MDNLHTYEFELSVDLLFRLRVLCTYFKHLMAKDFPGLTTGSPLRRIRIELPVADPEYEYHNLCWREPGRTSDVARYYSLRHHPRPVTISFWERAFEFLNARGARSLSCHAVNCHGCSCALSSIPTHAILDVAIFLGSDDLLHEWSDRLLRHMTFNNVPDIMMAIAQFANSIAFTSTDNPADNTSDGGMHSVLESAIARSRVLLRFYSNYQALSNQAIFDLIKQNRRTQDPLSHHCNHPIERRNVFTRPFQTCVMKGYLMNLIFSVYPDSLAFKCPECLVCHQPVLVQEWSGFDFMPCCTAKVHQQCRTAALLPYDGRCYFCGEFPDFSEESIMNLPD